MLTIPYFGAVLIALGAAACVSGVALRLPALPPVGKQRRILWCMIVLSTLVYTGLGIHKFDAWQLGLWDFGIYDSLMHNMVAHGQWMTDFRGKFDHFSPVLVLLAPFYAVWQHGYVLMALQAAGLALAAWPLYEYAVRYFPKGNFPLYAAMLYLLFPYYSRLALFDFHIECLFPLLFFGAFYFYATRRWRCFLVMLACAPMIKEDFVVPLAGCGLYLICSSVNARGVRGKNRFRLCGGLLLLAAAVGWAFFVLKIYYPWILQQEYWHYGRYELSAANLGIMAGRFFSLTTCAALTSVLLPAAFLPLWHWKSLLCILLPTLGIQMVSASLQQTVLTDHYGSALLATVPVLAIFGMRTYRWRTRRRSYAGLRRILAVFAPALLLTTHVMFCDLATVRHHEYLSKYAFNLQGGMLSLPFSGEHWQLMAAREAHAAIVRAKMPVFPQNLTVVAQNEIGMHFLRHRRVQALPGTMAADLYCFDQANIIDYRDNKKLNAVSSDPAYMLVFRCDDVLIFQKRTTVPENLRSGAKSAKSRHEFNGDQQPGDQNHAGEIFAQ